MLRSIQSQSRGLLILLALTALAFGACGGGTGTPTTGATPTGGSTAHSATPSPAPISGPVGGASALARVTSYQFTMTIEGGTLGDTLSLLPAASTDNTSFSLKGTYILKPAKAADVTVTGAMRVIAVDGSDYVDMGLTGEYTQYAASESNPSADPSASPDSSAQPAKPSLAESLSPLAFYYALDFGKGYDKQNSETKNGVETDHYVANDAGKAVLAQMGAVEGVPDAQWSGEVWIAKTGGYPVSLRVTATVPDPAGGVGTTVYQRVFDITKVDDPSNKVTAPTNVTGA
jgi:hypothetical protein